MATLSYACVLVRDLTRLADFYREVLQVEPEWTGPYAEYPTGPGVFCLWSVDAYAALAGTQFLPKSQTSSVMLEFQVDDVDAEYTRLKQSTRIEAEFVLPPTTMAWGNRSIYLRDPEGNLINLFTPVR
ncbi:MAG: VOC family protein [Chloroflexi bacterium]|nr:VOC family protein [Chloroflexota bacterium]